MTTALEQLMRVLRFLPLTARKGGLTFAEAAQLCGVTEKQIQNDVKMLTSRADYLPGGSPDDFQILLTGDRIELLSTGVFRRPIRMDVGELLAVSIALRCAGSEAETRERLCGVVEGSLALRSARREEPVEADVEMDVVLTAASHGAITETFSRGVMARKRVRFGYVKSRAESPEIRTMEPWRILYGEGEGYVVGRDVDRDAPRLFRIDRVLGAELRSETFEPAIDFDYATLTASDGVQLLGDQTEERWATIRYSPHVARWVRERYPTEETDSGAVLVRHRVLSDAWIVRHVLQYGIDAEVLEPSEIRARVRAAVAGAV